MRFLFSFAFGLACPSPVLMACAFDGGALSETSIVSGCPLSESFLLSAESISEHPHPKPSVFEHLAYEILMKPKLLINQLQGINQSLNAALMSCCEGIVLVTS